MTPSSSAPSSAIYGCTIAPTARQRAVELSAETIWVAPIEYVILQKLRYFRDSGSDRHLRDIANMRRISGHLIDQATLDTWLHRLGLTPEWQKVPSTT